MRLLPHHIFSPSLFKSTTQHFAIISLLQTLFVYARPSFCIHDTTGLLYFSIFSRKISLTHPHETQFSTMSAASTISVDNIPDALLEAYRLLLKNDTGAIEFLFGSRLSKALRVPAQRAANHYAISKEDAIEELRRFLAIKVFTADVNATKISPTPLMDQLWHAAILDTQFYAELQSALGMIIHHQPSGADEREAKLREDWLTDMTALYIHYFTAYPTELGLVQPSRTQYTDGTDTSISVFVNNLKGNIITFFFGTQTTIGLVKIGIQERDGTPVDHQQLYFAGKRLEDDETLADYGISNESALHLVLRPSGC